MAPKLFLMTFFYLDMPLYISDVWFHLDFMLLLYHAVFTQRAFTDESVVKQVTVVNIVVFWRCEIWLRHFTCFICGVLALRLHLKQLSWRVCWVQLLFPVCCDCQILRLLKLLINILRYFYFYSLVSGHMLLVFFLVCIVWWHFCCSSCKVVTVFIVCNWCLYKNC